MDLFLKELKNSTILVTGGAGFIGSNICDFLVTNNINVICLDNLSTGKIDNISDLMKYENFKFIEADITDLKSCNLACKNVDFVLHQAALGSVPRSIKDPVKSTEVNILGFLNMLISSRDNKIKRFVYAASSSTYGDSKQMPKVESIIGKPLSPYAITKFVNELYAENFSNLFDLETIGLRYFNVFGRKQDPNGPYAAVIPKFVDHLLNHMSPTINGDGSYSRDFTYIENVIQMNIIALTTKNPKSINQVYNTAYGEQTSILELFNLLRRSLARYDKNIEKIVPIFGSIREGDVPHSLASIEKAKRLLNYKPSFDIKLGINQTIDWYWENK